MEIHWISLAAVVTIVLTTAGIGLYATRVVRTTSDYYVASRAVGPFLNASAISGEYLSAASFLGVAGMVMKFGYDVLWYPVGYTAGYLMLLLFVAAPLRRFGAYTIPDFAEGRLESPNLRKLSVVFVLIIGLFYTLPQMKGAGITLRSILGVPYWLGVVTVGVLITLNVALGGMKGITFMQAFQSMVKMFAISVPTFFMFIHFGAYDQLAHQAQSSEVPTFSAPTTLEYGANSGIKLYAPSQFIAAEQGTLVETGGKAIQFSAGDSVMLPPGTYFFRTFTRATFPKDAAIPDAPDSQSWIEPFGPLSNSQDLALLYTYSLMIAIVFGTAGLPHILVRFYTNRDGHTARKTTYIVLGLIGFFYLFPPIIGALGRLHVPELYASGTTDAVVLKLPEAVAPSLFGEILSAITSAGAFAAFLSTTSGLMISASSALSHDIYGRIINPRATARRRLAAFKISSLLVGGAVIVFGLQAERFDINALVGWAFAIAASCFFPLLTLGAWWRRLTSVGAASGLALGGALSSASIIYTMFAGPQASSQFNPLLWTLLVQPALWSLPVAFLTMVGVSLATQKRVPADVKLKMLRLHVPESLGLRTDYITE
ncbi:MAG: cation acetate symporter [Dehalococcoidales bacterium]|nr:cation acetate symporter [Dehalococcoidales bacterium]